MCAETCRKRKAAVCSAIYPIEIETDGTFIIAGKCLTTERATALAASDGNGMTLSKCINFFRFQYGLPMQDFVLIGW